MINKRRDRGRVSGAVLAVLVHHVSLCRWHPLGQGHSRNSLGRFMWSQCLPSRPTICTEQQTGLFVQRSPGLGVSEAGVPVLPWPWMAGMPFGPLQSSRPPLLPPGAESLLWACSGQASQPLVPLPLAQLSLLPGYRKKQTKAACVGC